MRILLIQPPIEDFYRTRFREYPLGLLYLAAALEGQGFSVHILDARRCKRPTAIRPPRRLEYLMRYYTPENDLFRDFYHFGMDYAAIGDAVASYRPDCACINAMCTPYVGEVLETARAVKRALPRCRIIVGGHHATADPDSLFANGCVDQVVRGEGEEILVKILRDQTNGAVVSDEDGEPFRVPNLDSISHPARHLVDPRDYRYGKKSYAMILTSRGCPHRCSFCSVHTLAGHVYRKRRIGGVLDEIDECVGRHAIGVLDFQDDNLLFERDRVLELFEALVARHDRFGIEFLASNGLNVAHLDDEILQLMKRCGFSKLDIAIGTGDVNSRTALKRPEEIDMYERVLEAAGKIGFPVTTYIILGMPTQPLADMEATVRYLMGKDTLIAPSVFYNVPGMPVFDRTRRYEYVDDHVARRGTALNTFGDDFARDDIVRLMKAIRGHNLSRPGMS